MIKKYNLFETIIILTLILMLVLIGIAIGGGMVSGIVLSILIISLAGGVRIISHQDLPAKNKCVLHGLATYYFYSAILCLFLTYIWIMGGNSSFDGIYIWLTTVLFGVTVPTAIICRIHSGKNITILRNVFAICFLIEIFLIGIMHNSSIDRNLIVSTIYILLAVSKIMYFVIGKMIEELNTVKGRSYYNLFLIYNVIEYLGLLVLRNRDVIAMMILILQVIQIYCILRSGDKSWRGQNTPAVNMLNEVDKSLSDSDYLDNIIVNLSHELKTPVNIIKSGLDLLVLNCTDDEFQDDIANIKSECREIMSVVQLMIDIERIKRGSYVVKYKTYNMVAVVENVIDAIRDEYPKTNILFNPLMEEMFSITDLKLFQDALARFLVTIIDKLNIDMINIEMNGIDGDKIEINLLSNNVKKIRELLNVEEKFKYEDDIGSMLSIQYFIQALNLTKGNIKYSNSSKNDSIQIILPCTNESKIEVEYIDYSNVQELIEGIRCSYSMS